MAVEKLVQMDGCRKPQTQTRCEAAIGIQTTKEECGLMKETKIKPGFSAEILLLSAVNLGTARPE